MRTSERAAVADTSEGARIALEVEEAATGELLYRLPPDGPAVEDWAEVAELLEVLEERTWYGRRVARVHVVDRWAGRSCELTGRMLEDIGSALEAEHPCTDEGCEIRGAAAAGFTLEAVRMLTSATDELEVLSTVLELYREELEAVPAEELELEERQWLEHWAEHSAGPCPACNGWQYVPDADAPPARCNGCGSELEEVPADV